MIAEHIRSLLARFNQARVLVVGDVYLDEITLGRMTGVSLEAPVPVLEIHTRRCNAGAAGNVACNLATLGAKTYLVGVVGADPNSDLLRESLEVYDIGTGGLVVDETVPTNTYGKLKAAAQSGVEQEVLRTDTPTPEFISSDIESQVIERIRQFASEVDAIILIDQIASVATTAVLAEVVACSKTHDLLTVGDSRGRIGDFGGFDIVVPNDQELGAGLGLEVFDDASFDAAAKTLLKKCARALITCGPNGIVGFTQEGSFRSPALAAKVVDVTGAGDSVTAAATLTVLAGGSLQDAALIGNAAAAVAVSQRDVVTITRPELEVYLPMDLSHGAAVPLEALKPIFAALREEGKSIVWTNGCFDIIHAGHVTYLMSAKQEGDVLVVGLNSDASVSAVKGADRPIVPEEERALILSALACVDYVTIFSEEDVTPILKALQPDVYAKGGDYTLETINQDERRLVEGYGGRIALIPGVEGKSTTNLVQRLADEYGE